jgi:hypothetical protein
LRLLKKSKGWVEFRFSRSRLSWVEVEPKNYGKVESVEFSWVSLDVRVGLKPCALRSGKTRHQTRKRPWSKSRQSSLLEQVRLPIFAWVYPKRKSSSLHRRTQPDCICSRVQPCLQSAVCSLLCDSESHSAHPAPCFFSLLAGELKIAANRLVTGKLYAFDYKVAYLNSMQVNQLALFRLLLIYRLAHNLELWTVFWVVQYDKTIHVRF